MPVETGLFVRRPRSPGVLALGQAVLVAEDLLIAGLGAPESMPQSCFTPSRYTSALPPLGSARPMRRTWLPLKSTRARGTGVRGDVELAGRGAGEILRRPRSFIMEPVVRSVSWGSLPSTMMSRQPSWRIVTDAVAVGERFEGEAVCDRSCRSGKGLPSAETAPGETPAAARPRRGPGRRRWSRRSGLCRSGRWGPPKCAHDVVLARRAEQFRLPGEHFQDHPQGPGMGRIEPHAASTSAPPSMRSSTTPVSRAS